MAWQLGAKTELGRRALTDRGFRLWALALAHVAVAFALTLVFPLWLLLLGPLVLGVPHIASDLRFLVARPPAPLTRRVITYALWPLAAMTVLRLSATLGGPYLPEAELALGGAAILTVIWLTNARRSWRIGLALVLTATIAWALSAPDAALLGFAHLHNLVAVGLWCWLAARGGPGHHAWTFGLAVAVAIVALLSGALDATLTAGFSEPAAGLDAQTMALTMAPFAEPVVALRWVAAFAFAQAVHYAVWIRLMPQRMSGRQPPPTWRRTLEGWRRDLGTPALLGLAALTLSFVVAALFDAVASRHAYLTAALFHGWIELAVAGGLLAAARGLEPRS